MSQWAGIFGDMPTGQVLLIGAILVMSMTLLRNLRRPRPQAKSALAEPRPTRAPLADAQRAGDDIAVRLHEQFREWNARIDTKALVLRQLLLEADKKIAALEALTGDEARSKLQASPAPGAPPNPDSPSPVEDALVIEPDEANLPHAAPASAPSAPSDVLDPLARSADRFADIFQLADQGLSPAEIARSTHQAEGEIELILSLRDRSPPRPAG